MQKQPTTIFLYFKDDALSFRRIDTTGSTVGCCTGGVSEVLAGAPAPVWLYMFGDKSQASVILEAARLIYSEDRGRVLIATPSVLPTGAVTALETIDFMYTKLYEVPPRCGGWRMLALNDLKILQFLHNPTEDALLAHPAWPTMVMAFAKRTLTAKNLVIPTHPPKELVASLLTHIDDVHWYCTAATNLKTLEDGHSIDPLINHMHCTQKHVERWVHAENKASEQFRVLNTFVELCFGPAIFRSYENTVQLSQGLAGSVFKLCRSRSRADGGLDIFIKCLAETLQIMLEFIDRSWRHEVAPLGWELFVPKYFLERYVHPDLVAVRCQWLSALRESVLPRVGYQPLEQHKLWYAS